jgi:hypothetical protein
MLDPALSHGSYRVQICNQGEDCVVRLAPDSRSKSDMTVFYFFSLCGRSSYKAGEFFIKNIVEKRQQGEAVGTR